MIQIVSRIPHKRSVTAVACNVLLSAGQHYGGIMNLKPLTTAILAATFFTGSAALVYAESGSSGVGPSDTSETGLDRADEAAGEHGEQGRDNARTQQDEEGDSAAMEAPGSDAGGAKESTDSKSGGDAGDAEAGKPNRDRAVE
jgi:hypothetical protein